MKHTWTFYEFFAGGGMARAGLGDEWQCLLANDISSMKGAAYAANYGDDHLHIGDIYDLKPKDLPGSPDLAWGSFPCQDLSLAGAGAGLEGERSGCFWGFWKLIKGLNKAGRKPLIVVLENVYGALTSHDGGDFEAIIKAIAGEDYVAAAVVVDAVHFVPQSRPRLFIFGIDKSMTVPDNIVATGATPAWHPDALIRAYNRLPKKLKASWLWLNPGAPAKRQKTLDDIVEKQPQGVEWHSASETKRLLEMMSDVNRKKVMRAQMDGRLSVGTIYRRTRDGVQRAEVRFDGIAGCLRTPSGGSSRQTIIVVEGSSIRTRLLSPREAARLMGLDDGYKLPTRYNDAYHVAGDGVVVPVVAHLARHVLEPTLSTRAAVTARRAA
jgi:DNA (cytosine-5)-methyltransferase 1